MVRYTNANHALDVAYASAALQSASKRELIYAAVRAQLAADNKRPWSLSQKLGDAPYRYTRDTLWAALNSVSNRLHAGDPCLEFGVEDRFKHPNFASFADFVNKQLKGNVSELISEAVKASRWP